MLILPAKRQLAGSAFLRITPTPVVQSNTTDQTLTLTKPVGTVETDLLLATTVLDNGAFSMDAPIGFSEINDNEGGHLAYKVAGASEGASYVFSRSGSGGAADQIGTILRIPKGAYSLIGTTASPASGALAAPGITMPARGLLLAFFWRNTPGVTFSTPTNMKPVISANSEGSFAFFSQIVPAGATGTRTSTVSDTARGLLIGITKA